MIIFEGILLAAPKQQLTVIKEAVGDLLRNSLFLLYRIYWQAETATLSNSEFKKPSNYYSLFISHVPLQEGPALARLLGSS